MNATSFRSLESGSTASIDKLFEQASKRARTVHDEARAHDASQQRVHGTSEALQGQLQAACNNTANQAVRLGINQHTDAQPGSIKVVGDSERQQQQRGANEAPGPSRYPNVISNHDAAGTSYTHTNFQFHRAADNEQPLQPFGYGSPQGTAAPFRAVHHPMGNNQGSGSVPHRAPQPISLIETFRGIASGSISAEDAINWSRSSASCYPDQNL